MTVSPRWHSLDWVFFLDGVVFGGGWFDGPGFAFYLFTFIVFIIVHNSFI